MFRDGLNLRMKSISVMGQPNLRCISQAHGTGQEDTLALRWHYISVCEHQRVQAGDAKCNPQLSGITQVTTKLINNTMLVNKS